MLGPWGPRAARFNGYRQCRRPQTQDSCIGAEGRVERGQAGGAGAGGGGGGWGWKGGRRWGVTVEGWCRIRELGAEGRGGLGGTER